MTAENLWRDAGITIAKLDLWESKVIVFAVKNELEFKLLFDVTVLENKICTFREK